MHFAPYVAKQGQAMQLTADPPPAPGLCSACDSGSSFLWGPQHCRLLWEQTCSLNYLQPCLQVLALFRKYCSKHWEERQDESAADSKINQDRILFPCSHKKYVFKCFDLFSQNKQQLGNIYLCHSTAFQVTGQHTGYLDELIILHIVQSVWSVATSNNRGVCQDVSTTSPALEFKLE